MAFLRVSKIALKGVFFFNFVKLVVDPVIKLCVVVYLVLLVDVPDPLIEPEA